MEAKDDTNIVEAVEEDKDAFEEDLFDQLAAGGHHKRHTVIEPVKFSEMVVIDESIPKTTKNVSVKFNFRIHEWRI